MSSSTDPAVIADYLFGATEFVAILIGLLLNILTIPYFARTKEQFSSLMYLLIVITDILILLSCFPSALSMLNQRQPMIMSSAIVCTLSGFVFNVTSRMSVFLIALLGFARCYSVMFPFRKATLRCYLVPVVAYLAANVMLAALPLIFSPLGYHYSSYVAQCSWGINELSFVGCYGMSCSLWHWLTYATIILPWLVPGVVVVLSSTASICALLHSDRTRRHMLPRRKTNTLSVHMDPSLRTKRATITILIMTLVYSVFNMPCWLLYSYLLASGFNPISWLTGSTAIYVQIFVSRVSIALNSAINPIVYFLRIQALARLTFLNTQSMISHSLVSRASIALKLVPNIMRGRRSSQSSRPSYRDSVVSMNAINSPRHAFQRVSVPTGPSAKLKGLLAKRGSSACVIGR